ncbi:MAG: PhzF family phenazine biosynthesis protein [Marinibacterium sp.]|nr:PhzF family phenazine biosynthesis protein [Marinibacterium sp.]
MTAYPFDWVDAFTDRPFGGNGCAVVHGGAELGSDTCMAFTRETSLVECTFTGPSDVADIRVRYFLARQEIPFAGHPTLATVAALRSRGLFSGDALTLETGAGIIPVRLDGDLIEMTQVAPQFGPEIAPDLVAAAVGLAPDDIIAPPQIVSTGLPFVITLLRDRDALRAARIDPDAMARLRAALPDAHAAVMEPFLVTLGGATGQGATFSRLLLAPPDPPEDPFTGSATGAMASYLWSRGLLEQRSFLAEQGHDMGRPGQARVRALGPLDALQGVHVAGQATIIMRGEALLGG